MIRDANKEDIPAIQLIARLSIDAAYEELFHQDVREFAIDNYYSNEMMETLFDKGFCLLVRNEEKENVGFLSYIIQDRELKILGFYILPQFIGKGYASALMEHLILKERKNIDLISIDIESRNMPSQRFYARQGFKAASAYPQNLNGQPLKMVRLELKV